jgi:hypothetical protein
MIPLAEVVAHYAEAFKAMDTAGHVNPPYRPGVGPFGEPQGLALALQYLKQVYPQVYQTAGPKAYPGSAKQCDLVLSGDWAIECKLLRPFGDNGKEAEHWSENVLHPYAGHTSAVGDCLKLVGSGFAERKAILVYGFEHTPPKIPLEPAVRAFEIIAAEVADVHLGPRHTAHFYQLIHPVHQQGTVFGWEVLEVAGLLLRAPASERASLPDS